MGFQKAIGNHMKGSGLVEAWVESGLLGPNATEHVMKGKAYKRATCPQDYSAIIVAAADAFSPRIMPEIVPRSLPRNI